MFSFSIRKSLRTLHHLIETGGLSTNLTNALSLNHQIVILLVDNALRRRNQVTVKVCSYAVKLNFSLFRIC